MIRNPRRALSLVGAVGIVAVAVTGCSSAKDYTTPSQLRQAYVDAGGKCSNHFALPESMTGNGVRAETCSPSIDTAIIFDTDAAQRRYLAETVEGDMQAVVGDKWALITKDADKWAKPLGGKAQKG